MREVRCVKLSKSSDRRISRTQEVIDTAELSIWIDQILLENRSGILQRYD